MTNNDIVYVTKEAFTLLKLIDAEFRSDPKSTQCFDLRIVDRVRKCCAELELMMKRKGPVA